MEGDKKDEWITVVHKGKKSVASMQKTPVGSSS